MTKVSKRVDNKFERFKARLILAFSTSLFGIAVHAQPTSIRESLNDDSMSTLTATRLCPTAQGCRAATLGSQMKRLFNRKAVASLLVESKMAQPLCGLKPGPESASKLDSSESSFNVQVI